MNGQDSARATAEAPALLLVDDEKAFAEALAFRLETRGLPCLTAFRGEEALGLIDRPELEVVLLDLNMPGLHGLEVLRRVKARRPELEVVLLTGETDLTVAATGMRRGAGDYLVKPVDFDALLESVAKARRRSREHKERLRAAEAGKLMALGALAAGVGHEINNPLQIILQRSEWLHELLEDAEAGRPDFPEMLKSARIIQEQAKRAGEITSQLLGLAHKSREGKAESEASELISRAVKPLLERAGELGVEILVDVDPDMPLIPCSPAELEPVINHLLRNALDAIEVQTTRPMQSGREPAREPKHAPGGGTVRISAQAAPDLIRIAVEDTGEGIAPELAPYIFDPFFSMRPVGKGTGLGLTVCHSIITALRGSLRFTPASPQGAVFTVELPCARPAEAQAS